MIDTFKNMGFALYQIKGTEFWIKYRGDFRYTFMVTDFTIKFGVSTNICFPEDPLNSVRVFEKTDEVLNIVLNILIYQSPEMWFIREFSKLKKSLDVELAEIYLKRGLYPKMIDNLKKYKVWS